MKGKNRFKWKQRNRGATKGLPDYPKTLKGAAGFPPEPWGRRGDTYGDLAISVALQATGAAVGAALAIGIISIMFYMGVGS